MQCPIKNLKGDCLVPEAGKTEKRTNIFKNLKSEFCPGLKQLD